MYEFFVESIFVYSHLLVGNEFAKLWFSIFFYLYLQTIIDLVVASDQTELISYGT